MLETSLFLPGSAGGEVARFYYAGRENHGSWPEIAAALLFDRLMSVLCLILVRLPLLFAPFCRWFVLLQVSDISFGSICC